MRRESSGFIARKWGAGMNHNKSNREGGWRKENRPDSNSASRLEKVALRVKKLNLLRKLICYELCEASLIGLVR
jgi:hypothetical protein